MPLSIIVYDDAPNKKGSEAVAQGDGPPRGRELEIADLLRFIKSAGIVNTVWLTADVHYAAAHYYNPDKAQFQEFEPFWEFVSGPLHRRHLRAERTRQHVWAGGEIHQGARPGQAEPAAVGRDAVLRSRQNRRRNRADDRDLARSGRCGAVVDHFGPENRLTKCETTHCFLAFSEYIAPQRVRFARSFWPGFLFRRHGRLQNSRF